MRDIWRGCASPAGSAALGVSSRRALRCHGLTATLHMWAGDNEGMSGGDGKHQGRVMESLRLEKGR